MTLEYEKENSDYNLSFWPHPHSRSYRSGFASRTRPDYIRTTRININRININPNDYYNPVMDYYNPVIDYYNPVIDYYNLLLRF